MLRKRRNCREAVPYRIKIFCELEDIDEVSIGHAIIARAVFVGPKESVREMYELMRM
ncbi:MAG: pyridoxine 5'-phosphate synthase [Ignavibacteriaceae bacterium]|nr:pyridoxine 5'-phosphate synthase [Ignavibacteriaceae bacterium]